MASKRKSTTPCMIPSKIIHPSEEVQQEPPVLLRQSRVPGGERRSPLGAGESSKPDAGDAVKDGAGVYTCRPCDFETDDLNLFLDHVYSGHPDFRADPSFLCVGCSASSPKFEGLALHNARIHPSTLNTTLQLRRRERRLVVEQSLVAGAEAGKDSEISITKTPIMRMLKGKSEPKQSLAEPYAGIFHFRFWQYGEWVEVVVDDKLPVREGRLLFSYSHTRHEFWSALVEKAYAKLMGSYGSLKGGNISEGMEDFTGGIAYSLEVSSRTPRVLWRCLTAALSRGSLLSCFIQATSYREVGKVTEDGLIKGHAYAITDTDKVKKTGMSEEILLYKLRNPWGFIEYRGPWSDKSKAWDDVAQSEKQRIELKSREDGEFWISSDDFNNLFHVVELCSLKPESLEEGNSLSGPAAWTISEHEGSWIPGSSAGGSRRYRKTFWQNPQFELILREQDEPEQEEDEDEEDEDGEEDEDEEMTAEEKKREEKQKQKAKKCTVLVELLQKNRRRRDKIHFLYIAFHIYKVQTELQGLCLTQSFFLKNRPVGRSGKYKSQRGVWRKLHLDPGNYIIVASSYRPNQAGDFFVRIFSKTGNTLGTYDFICSSGFLPVLSPPSQEDHMRVQKTFDKEANPDDKLNATESMNLFNSVLVKDYHLPLDVCRQLIFQEDTKGRCTLSRDQAETLLSNLRNLQFVFFRFDEDSSGTMSPFELSAALESVGMQCDNKVVQLLTARFASGELHMPFYGFVSCVTRLRKLFALYESETSQEVKNRGINAWLLQFLVV